jgi:hypothetical protein
MAEQKNFLDISANLRKKIQELEEKPGRTAQQTQEMSRLRRKLVRVMSGDRTR